MKIQLTNPTLLWADLNDELSEKLTGGMIFVAIPGMGDSSVNTARPAGDGCDPAVSLCSLHRNHNETFVELD